MADRARIAVVAPALLVAVGAVAATAHGLFEVAVASQVPAGVAWLYPLITDGLALVAYAATHQLARAGAMYAWLVVVVAAGLSGLAQATYLASGPALDTSPMLRFGVGYWPALAGAVAAHLVYLLLRSAADAAGASGLAPAGEVPASEAGASEAAEPVEDTSALVDDQPAPDEGLAPAGEATAGASPSAGAREWMTDLLVHSVAKNLAAAKAKGDTYGRPTICREHGLKDHQARAVLDEIDRRELAKVGA